MSLGSSNVLSTTIHSSLADSIEQFLDQTAVVNATVPGGKDDTARTVVIAALMCSEPMPMNDEEKERAGLATVTWLYSVFAEIPSTAIQQRQRLVLGGIDYYIRSVLPTPKTSPIYYELYIEDEGITV